MGQEVDTSVSDNVVLNSSQFIGCAPQERHNCPPSLGKGNPHPKIYPSKYCPPRSYMGFLLSLLMMIVFGLSLGGWGGFVLGGGLKSAAHTATAILALGTDLS